MDDYDSLLAQVSEPKTFSEMNRQGQEMRLKNPSADHPMTLCEIHQQNLARPLSFIDLMKIGGQTKQGD